MNAVEVKKHLFSLNSKGIKYDLNRITEAARRCGNPHLAYKCFHVAGTNGKGSTCAYLESMLRVAGFKTALYSSPHLLNFEERFQIDGKIIDENQWLEVYCDLKQVADELNLTFFETTTLMAFELFKRNKVQWAVIETGLGGRLDATNIIRPEVAVITRIALDHMDLLGKDLESIASEKAGIIKSGIPAVVASSCDQQVRDIFRQTCSDINAPLIEVSFSDAADICETASGTLFSRKGKRYQLKMPGKFQVINALLALEAMEQASLLCDSSGAGLSKAFLPGRFQQIFFRQKRFILDVGHNPDAAEVLVENLKKRFKKESVCIVTGIMKDKDYPGILKKYSEIADTIILSRPEVQRASMPEELMKSIPQGSVQALICNTIAEALSKAVSGPHQVICVAGSFYTVGEVCGLMGIDLFAKETAEKLSLV
ncbi:MAG: bifunctional folylpolyglutamate synthase/dihydrofolate synthase [Fibrobacter sp.]|jgi:dihydrofolate synthase/folylpolyglutamate synthase|nr:bifunctional folylpolyglutamate synthase/dihydrofolate synthase [Fibrobacter sp.]